MRTFLALAFFIFASAVSAAPWALIEQDKITVAEIREWASPPADQDPNTVNRFWLPYEIIDPPYDPVMQIKSGPIRSVLTDKVQDIFTVRAKTPQELSDETNDDQQGQLDKLGEVGFKALFLLDSRARKLRGDPVIDEPTFQNQLRSLRKNPIPNPDPRAPMTLLRFDASVTIGSVAGATFTDKTFAVPGLLTTDLVMSVTFTAGLLPATISYGPARVSAIDTLSVRFGKIATGAVVPPTPQAISILIWRP